MNFFWQPYFFSSADAKKNKKREEKHPRVVLFILFRIRLLRNIFRIFRSEQCGKICRIVGSLFNMRHAYYREYQPELLSGGSMGGKNNG